METAEMPASWPTRRAAARLPPPAGGPLAAARGRRRRARRARQACSAARRLSIVVCRALTLASSSVVRLAARRRLHLPAALGRARRARAGARPLRPQRPRHPLRGGGRAWRWAPSGARLRRGRAALAAARPRAHAARRRLADHPRDRAGAAPGPLVRLRRAAARHRLRAHRLLPHGGDRAARGCARPTRSSSCSCARSTPAAGTSSGACGCPARRPFLAAGLRTGVTLSLVGRGRRRVDRQPTAGSATSCSARTRAWRRRRRSRPCC